MISYKLATLKRGCFVVVCMIVDSQINSMHQRKNRKEAMNEREKKRKKKNHKY